MIYDRYQSSIGINLKLCLPFTDRGYLTHWCLVCRVFDQLEFTKNHSGLFLFLEEDHYVAPDFLHVLKLMSDARPQHCPTCNILSLGTYLKVYNYRSDTAKVSGIDESLRLRADRDATQTSG